jgi:hypothetical protein
MKIRKPWSWVVSVLIVTTAPIWILPLALILLFGGAVTSFHDSFFED